MSSYPPQGQAGFTPGTARPSSSDATVALVMGILGLTCCPLIFSALALYYASRAEEQLRLNPGMDGASTAKAGKVLGIVGFAFFGLVIAFYGVAGLVSLATEA